MKSRVRTRFVRAALVKTALVRATLVKTALVKTALVMGVFVTSVLVVLAGSAAGSVTILVDEVHGRTSHEPLGEWLPNAEITTLTCNDFEITDMLTSGVISGDLFETTFEVPPEADALYGRFVFEGAVIQLPYIDLYDPEGAVISEQCDGSFHVENPAPGTYRLTYNSWEPEITTTYEIGTGPHFLTAENLADFDVVCCVWDDTWFLFTGPLPPYSSREETILESYVEGGGGFLYVREPMVEIVLKPIVNLYASQPLNGSVDVVLPGMLTYAEPLCESVPVAGGTLCRWGNLSIAPGERTQILYEGKPYRRHAWLAITGGDGEIQVVNRTENPLLEPSLIRRLGRDDWELIQIASLPGGSDIDSPPVQHLTRSAVATHLQDRLREGGRKAGLYAEEIEEFLAHYVWDQRWLAEADADGAWCALYRLSPEAMTTFMPAATAPESDVMARALWVWAVGLTDDTTPLAPATPNPMVAGADPGEQGGLIYHEYGVLRQTGVARAQKAMRDPNFLGWEFYDNAFIIDPVDNCGEEHCVLYYLPGGASAADEILTPNHDVRGLGSSVIIAPGNEILLRGDEYCQTADGIYPPGSFPPVAAVREQGGGRIAAFHDRNVLDNAWFNEEFVRNLVDWLARVSTSAPDIPASPTRLVGIQPNPFNPRTTVIFHVAEPTDLRLAVYDAAGKLVTELATGHHEPGTHSVVWQGNDARGQSVPSGVYMARFEAEGKIDTRKMVLVR